MRNSSKFLAGGLLAFALGLTGCLTDSKDGDKGLTVSAPSNQSVSYGDTIKFNVTAAGGTAPYTYQWYGKLGNVVEQLLGEDSASVKTVADAEETPDGMKIWAKVTDSKGNVAISDTATLTIVFDDLKVLSVGAQGNSSLGSVVDLDSGKVWQSATANLNVGKIDLVYMFYAGKLSLNGARAARDSGTTHSINLTNGYGSAAKEIQFIEVSSKPASVAAATTIYEAGPRVRSAVVSNGKKYVTLSSEGRYFYIEVSDVTGTDNTATAKVSFSAGEIKD
jgi:hypothetical protein